MDGWKALCVDARKDEEINVNGMGRDRQVSLLNCCNSMEYMQMVCDNVGGVCKRVGNAPQPSQWLLQERPDFGLHGKRS